MFSKSKKIIVLFIVSLGLSIDASDPSQEKSNFLKKMSSLSVKIYNYAIDYPVRTGVAVGSMVAVACLVSSELRVQNEDVKELARDKSLLKLPFSHGLTPYYLGSITGAAAGVITKKAKLSREVVRVLDSSSEVSKKAGQALDKTRAQKKKLDSINNLAQENNNLAGRLLVGSGSLLDDSIKLSTSLFRTKGEIDEAAKKVDGVKSSLLKVSEKANLVSKSVEENNESLKSLSWQNGRKYTALYTSGVMNLYGLSQVKRSQDRCVSGISALSSAISNVSELQSGQDRVFKSDEESVLVIQKNLDNTSASISRSLALVKELKTTKTVVDSHED